MSLRKQLARLLFSALGIPTEGQLLGFDNAAQLPAWVDPAGGGGSLPLSHVRGSGAANLNITPASYSTPVNITDELALEVGVYAVKAQYDVDADGHTSPQSLGFKYTGTATFTSTKTDVYGVRQEGSQNVVSFGICVSGSNGETPEGLSASGGFPYGNVCWENVITVTGAGTVRLSATIRDDEGSHTYLIKSGFLTLTKLS